MVLQVLTQDEFVSSMAEQLDQILIVLYALLGLSLLVSILGIINILALFVIERTREIGLFAQWAWTASTLRHHCH